MTDNILFQVTADSLETGLRGYPVGYCTTSYIDPVTGLFYRDYSIRDIAHCTCEEVIYLLWYGKKANAKELSKFSELLKSYAEIDKRVLDAISALPRAGHPMKLMASALLILSMFATDREEYDTAALKIISQIPILSAWIINHHAGLEQKSSLTGNETYIERFCSILNMPCAENKQFVDIMRLFNILHYDHGGGNLSTFVGKAVASGLEDMYGSLTSAILALAGPRHGKANQDCFEFLTELMQQTGIHPTDEEMEKIVRNRLAKNQLIFGFGHAVLRVEDPRATVLYDTGMKYFPNSVYVQLAYQLRRVASKVLAENPKISDPHPNVDAISGAVVHAAGFKNAEYLPVLFGMSRVVGIARQIVYERLEARNGRGAPIVRPKYIYKGKTDSTG